jgi:apolipoprotein N-acyltransferase
VFAGLGIAGAARLAGADSGTVPGVVLRLVQPNIPQAEKGDSDLWLDQFALYLEMSAAPGAAAVTHVIWPETAVPYFLDRDANARRAVAAVAPPGGAVITGAPRVSGTGDDVRYWNSLQAVTAEGVVAASYDKAHLVPFGEYVPLRDILPIDKVTPGQIDFSAGPGPRTLDLPGVPPVSPLICYEAIFPGAVVAGNADGQRPAWLLNVTNDAWYGQTAGPHQHFAIAQTRAVEEGLPLVRVATTGISGVVDPYGRITARLELGQRDLVDTTLPVALSSPPPYARLGDLPFCLLTFGFLVVALAAHSRAVKNLAY